VNRVALAVLLALLGGCVAASPTSTPRPGVVALEAAMLKHIEVLASDDFGGRRPGTEGEAKTLRYLSREWQAAGLESGTNDPANPWFAPVELALSIPDRSRAAFMRGRARVAIPDDQIAVFTSGRRGLVEGAPLVFVGEAGEQIDRSQLAGRVALMLWDHVGQAEQREALFEKGAAAVVAVIASPDEFRRIVDGRRHGAYRLAGEEGGGLIDGFITASAAQTLLGAAKFDALRTAARASDFNPVPLDLAVTLEATSTPGAVRTHNLIGKLPGRHPEAGAVLVLAHWDHFGQCAEPPATDLICNGAVDNASGLALMTELARRLAAGPRMDRDVYFLASTGEEWGLLGAQAFAQNPPAPLDTIVAAFNLDMVAVAPRGTPVGVVGQGLTRLDSTIAEVVRANGRKLADPSLAREFLRRQDGWALLQRDVPAVEVSSTFGDTAALDRFLAAHYHQPSDEAAGIELGGAAEDLLLHIALVRRFADAARYPSTAAAATARP
jgi:hypothetical protein